MSQVPSIPYRIGTVSKTTGIPVTTLRIWEARYGAFTPLKTEGKQRLYTEADVSKAMLLKQLTHKGHAIGSVAHLDVAQLRRLYNQGHGVTDPSSAPDTPVTLTVIGQALANRIEASSFQARLGTRRLHIGEALSDLASAALTRLREPTQVLLVKVNSLHPSVQQDIQALMDQHGLRQAVVLYHFAPDAVVQAMRFSGMVVRREPLSEAELAELLQSVTTHAPTTPATTAGPRKFSDTTLNRVASMAAKVHCECPRHVAELLSQLAHFEQYSQECLERNADDAHLHRYLHTMAGTARTLFENALEKIAAHEGIDLSETPT